MNFILKTEEEENLSLFSMKPHVWGFSLAKVPHLCELKDLPFSPKHKWCLPSGEDEYSKYFQTLWWRNWPFRAGTQSGQMPADKRKSSPLVWPCWLSIMFLEAKSWHGRGSGMSSTHFGTHFEVSFFSGFELWPQRSCTCSVPQILSSLILLLSSFLNTRVNIIILFFFSSIEGEAVQSFHLNCFYTVTGISFRAFLLQPAFLQMDSTKLSHVSVIFLIRNLTILSG